MKSTLPVIPDSYIPLSSHNHEITQARRYGMDTYMVFKMNTGIFLAFENDLYRGGSPF